MLADLLRMELSDLFNADFDISLTGFSPTEIDELLTDVCSGSQNQDTGITCFHFYSCKQGGKPSLFV